MMRHVVRASSKTPLGTSSGADSHLRRLAGFVLSLSIVAGSITAGCGGSGGSPATSGGSPDTATPTVQAPGTASPAPTLPSAAASTGPGPTASGSIASLVPVAIPDTPVGSRLAWVLEQVNGKAADLRAGDLSSIFAQIVLDQVPAAQLVGVLQQIASAAPFTLIACEGSPDGTQALARISSAAALLEVTIVVDSSEPHLITGLFFKPVTDVASVNTWEALDSELAKLVSQSSVLSAEIVDGRCFPVHDLRSTQVLAIGSAFKLYVLGELAHQVAAGRATWDETVAVHDEWKSLPSGTTQDEPAGTTHPLSHYASLMISISDNTAADHVLHRLGRENVEAYLDEMGMADPSRDIPWIGARDLFVLKATRNRALADSYLAADAAGRRELLDGDVASTPVSLADLSDWTAPRAIDTLEWFASTSDLCAAMAKLHELSTEPGLAEVRDILAVNPGIEFDTATWPYVGFKGGSEAGVLQLTWLLRRADDRWFVLSMTLNDQQRLVDEASSVSLAGDAVKLLAGVP